MEEKGKGRRRDLSLAMRSTGILLLLIILILIATPAAVESVKVLVNAPEHVEEGASFAATIDAHNIKDFNTGIFDLSFNSSVVVVTDVEDGRLDVETIPVDSWVFMDEDTIRVILEIPGVTGVNGSGYLAKICFEAVGEEDDKSLLDLSNGMLVSNKAEEIPTEWLDAEVRIVKGELEPTPTPPADRVHNIDTGENFSSIQAAIDDPDTKDGHVIEVEDGVFYETVDVTKSLTIQSKNGSANCIVQATSGNVFEITADHACIRGFTMKGVYAWDSAGIYVNANYCIVSNNIYSNNYYGILLRDSNNNKLTGNIMLDNGLVIKGDSLSDYTHEIDESNTVNGKPVYYWKNREGGKVPDGAGQIILVNCSRVIVENQKLNNVNSGIQIGFSSYITIKNNICSNNSDNGIHLHNSSINLIYLNNFINNTANGYSFDDTNVLHSKEEITYTYNETTHTSYLGNYWSDYNGTDADNDGIGDNPYYITDRNDDNYPLMKPFKNYHFALIPDIGIHKVHNLNTGGDFLTIQDAIDIPDTKDGHIIEVDDGVYSENVEVTKSLTIRSKNGSANCIVQAENPNAHVFAITANNTDLSGFTVKGATDKTGIYLEASYCNISNNNVTNNEYGISLHYSCNNTLINNTMSGNKYNFDVYGERLSNYIQNIDASNLVDGKPVYYCVNQKDKPVPDDAGFVGIVNSTNITVSNLTLTDNGAGVLFVYTNNSRIENVTTSNNNYGIYLWRSYNNTLTGNTMSGNAYNLCVFGDALCHYLQNIDMSNLVDEKTVYYWINQKDKQIPKDAGFVGIINSTNITVSDLTLTNNIRGVLLAYTSNSRIERVNASNNNYGIFIVNSSNNTISNSTICENNRNGIYMDSSSNNVILNNLVCKNKGWRGVKLCDSSDLAGIKLCDSPDNMISNNTICENICDGIWLERSSNNTISNNRICKHRITGVFLEDASNNNTISHNIICENFNGIGVSWDEPSNNNVISHNRICKNDYGIRVCSGLGHMISNNEICENNGTGIMLAGSNSIIINNTVNSNHEHGISLRHSNNNTLTNNIVNSNSRGIFMEWGPCNNNTLIDNTANRNREYGIYLDGSNKTLKGNNMANNKRNFAADFTVFLPDNDIDKTNLVDGKPIYYIKNAYGIIIDAITNAGVVYCINCDNITVRDLTLANNSAGVCFYGTNNSRIENVKAMSNDYGIYLSDSKNNTLKDTIANSNCEDGFRLECSNNNTLRNNFASINDDGFCLFLSNDNILTDNTASNNHNGTKLIVSFNSLIYLNNFVYNTRNFHSAGSNIWNSISKVRYTYRDKTYTNYLGNYWSDYNGSDADKDGIGDTSYVIIGSDNDNYPLMLPFENYK